MVMTSLCQEEDALPPYAQLIEKLQPNNVYQSQESWLQSRKGIGMKAMASGKEY